MPPIPVGSLLFQNQECNLPLPDAASLSAAGEQVGHHRSFHFFSTGRRKRSWLLAATLLAGASAGAQNGVFLTPQPVGVISGAQSVTVTAQSTGAVATVEVLTLGKPGLDFAGIASSSTCPTANLAPTQTCTESVTFMPASPGQRAGAVVLLDSNNAVLGTAYLSGTGVGGLGVLVPGNLITVAGVYRNWTSTQDGILATMANLDQPSSIAFDGAGNMYIADSAHNRIRMVAAPVLPATAGIISTYAGTGNQGYSGDGQLATAASLSSPAGVALDGAGNLYIADTGNNVIRMVSAATGIITTVAGSFPGLQGFAGDGGPATSAELDSPQSVTVDGSGNLYVADTANQRIRRVTVPIPPAAAGNITTVAGNGDTNPSKDGSGTYTGDGQPAIIAGLNLPYGVAFDSAGNMYIPDKGNNVIRKVAAINGAITASSVISTAVGFSPGKAGFAGDGGPATAALLSAPSGVAVDAAGNLYIADTQNTCIRKVTGGTISTLVTNNAGNYLSPGETIPAVAQIYAPVGLSLDEYGNLYFADYFYMFIEEIQSNEAVLNFTPTPIQVGKLSAPQTQTVENDGNAPLTLTNFALTNAVVNTGAGSCSLTTPLAVDADCLIYAVFAPSLTTVFAPGVAAELLDGNIDISGNTLNYPLNIVNFPLDIILVGVATPENATTLALSSSSQMVATKIYDSSYGQNVTFTAIVTSGAGTPIGTVAFMDGATQLGTPVTLNASGVATYSTATLTVGTHTISAAFTPSTGSGFLPSPPDSLTQNVGEVTATQLTSSANPSVLGASVIFTATVSISGGGSVTPAGTVTFMDTTTGTILGTQTLGPSDIVSVSTATLTYGRHTITATYNGDAANDVLGSTGTLIQDVQAASTTRLNSNPNPSYYGNPVLFTVTVPTIGTVAATGTVNILEAGVASPIGTVTLAGTPGTGTLSISTLAVGTDVITASYVGDAYYGPSVSSPAINQVVNQAQTSTTVAALPNPGIAGAPVAITATVTVTQGISKPTGTVNFTDGAVSLGSATLSNTGTATINPTLTLSPPNHSIVATYMGDTNDAGSASAPLLLTVVQATTSTVLTSAQNPSLVTVPVTFTAKVTGNGGTPSGNVTFTDTFGGATVPLACTPQPTAPTATCTISSLVVGTHVITATYAGDTNDAGSTSNSVSQVVSTIPTFTGLGYATSGSGATVQLILAATVVNNATAPVALPMPTGTVTFNTVNNGTLTSIGTVPLDSSGVATLIPAGLAPGVTSFEAVYSGDADHSPSTSTITSATNPSFGFTITVTPAAVSMATTQNATVSVILTSIDGFTDTIGLGCASLPAGINCHFSTPAAILPANGAKTVALTIDTNNPLGGGSSAMNVRPGSSGFSLAGVYLPLSVLFGGIFWRFRRRYTKLMTLALALLLGGASLAVSGCSGFSQMSASPGTYVIQVTGIGATSNITHFQNVTLTITK